MKEDKEFEEENIHIVAKNFIVLMQNALNKFKSSEAITEETWDACVYTFRRIFKECSVDMQRAILAVKPTRDFDIWIKQYLVEEDVNPSLRLMQL